MTSREKYIAFKAIFIREILRFYRIWVQTILPPIITTALYFIIFGSLIGSQVRGIHGVSYMSFIAPGLIMLAVISNAYANVVSSFFSSKFQRNIEEMLVAPVPSYLIVIGYTAGGVARGVAVGIAVTLTAGFFGEILIYNIWVILSIFILASILFSLAGLINGILAKKFDDVTIIPTFVLTPLTYLGGVFYSIDLLSNFWQQLSLFNPILHIVNAFRYGFLGISDVNLAGAYGICILIIVLLYGIALYLMRKGHGIRT